jgi:hypothetical protein
MTFHEIGPPFTDAVRSLLAVPGVKHYAQRVLVHRLSASVDTEAIINVADGKEFSNAVRVVHGRASDMLKLTHAVLPTETPTTISIRLPEFVSFDDLTALVGELKWVFERHVRLTVPGATIAVSTFETGSPLWLSLQMDTASFVYIVSFLSTVIHYYMYRKALDNKTATMAAHLAPGELQTLQALHDKSLPLERRRLMQRLNVERDYENEVDHAVEKATKLLERGMQIAYALNPPREVSEKIAESERVLAEVRRIEQLLAPKPPQLQQEVTPAEPSPDEPSPDDHA